MSKHFDMPPAYTGQIVRWKAHPGSDTGVPAIVIRPGVNCLALLVLHESTVGGIPYDGVIHERDPKFDSARFGDRGVWGYVEEQDDYLAYLLSRESSQ